MDRFENWVDNINKKKTIHLLNLLVCFAINKNAMEKEDNNSSKEYLRHINLTKQHHKGILTTIFDLTDLITLIISE